MSPSNPEDIVARLLRHAASRRLPSSGPENLVEEDGADEIERLRFALKLCALASGGPDQDGNNFIVETVEDVLGSNGVIISKFEHLRALNAEMLAVLKCLFQDKRFQVAIGGNPIAVQRLIDRARDIIEKGESR